MNPYLEINQYPLPRPEELFAALNGGEKFTKLDFSEAYLQIELEDESKQYLVINTRRGLYRFNRLPYGVASAPTIFQKIMEQILPKVPGVVCYVDDILVIGRNDDEHLEHLEAVFQASNSVDSELKEQNAGSSKTQWSTWAVWSAKKVFRHQRGKLMQS